MRSQNDIPVGAVVIINKERSEGVKKRDQATTAIRAKRRKLTLKQRCSLLSGQSKWSSQGIPEQEIYPFVMSDGPHGLRREKEDGSSYPATCFPPEVTLSCSWDPKMVYRVAAAIAEEAVAQGVDVILGPGLNIKRSPLCGRNFEYFSEEPLLSGTLGKAYIEGAKSRCVETCVKHFFANNQESNRMTIDVRMSERAAREIYIRPFEIAIRGADPGMVMAAYNQINGTYATEHRHALTTLLRDQWHYRGVTVSDWSAVQNRESSVRAGLDLEMPDSDGVNDEKVYRAVRRLALPEGCVNRSVERLIAFGERCEANRQARRELTLSSTAAHHQLARRAAAESIVLLENKHQLLPLVPEKLPRDHRLLVVGALAETPRLQGGGSSQVNANWIETPWDSLKAVYADVQLDYAEGYALSAVSDNEQQALSARALKKAAQADTVLLFVGLPESAESESWDRSDMNLPVDQLKLMDQLTAAHHRVVVIVQNGGAVLLGHAACADAVLEAWLGGEACGPALCDVLSGKVIPSGKLTETIPKRLEDTPAYLNFPGDGREVDYGEGIYVGYRFYDAKNLAVQYPFGYGLSYAEFEYTGFSLKEDAGDALIFEVKLKNHSDFAAKETIQIYVGMPDSAVSRPPKVLAAYQKVDVPAGAVKHVTIAVPKDRLAYFDTGSHQWRIESGTYCFYCGASSRNLKFKRSAVIDMGHAEPVITANSTVQEVLRTERGQALFQQAVDFYHKLTGFELDMHDDFIVHSVMATPLAKVPMLSGGMLTDRMLRRVIRYINHDVRHLGIGFLAAREVNGPKVVETLIRARTTYSKNQAAPYSVDTPIDLLLASPEHRAVLASLLGPKGESILSHAAVRALAKTHLTLRQLQAITPLHLFKKSALEQINTKLKAIHL